MHVYGICPFMAHAEEGQCLLVRGDETCQLDGCFSLDEPQDTLPPEARSCIGVGVWRRRRQCLDVVCLAFLQPDVLCQRVLLFALILFYYLFLTCREVFFENGCPVACGMLDVEEHIRAYAEVVASECLAGYHVAPLEVTSRYLSVGRNLPVFVEDGAAELCELREDGS